MTLIAEGFFLTAIIIFILRMARWNTEGRENSILDFLSLLFMIFALFFFVFPGVSAQTGTTIATNLSITGNVVTIYNLTTTESHIAVNSDGFIMITVICILWAVLMAILAVRDFIAAGGFRPWRGG